jgi:hypothetical protein
MAVCFPLAIFRQKGEIKKLKIRKVSTSSFAVALLTTQWRFSFDWRYFAKK